MNPPPPTSPSLALWTRYVGAGASDAEQIAVATALCAGVLLGTLSVDAGPLTLTVLAILGADVCGGLVAHLSAPAGRPAARSAAAQARWVGGQLLQYALFVALLRGGEPVRLAVVAGAVVAGTLVVHFTPVALQRRAGLAVLCAALVAIDASVGLLREAGWFLPLLLTKILVAYVPLSDENEPARPGENAEKDAEAVAGAAAGGSLPHEAQEEPKP